MVIAQLHALHTVHEAQQLPAVPLYNPVGRQLPPSEVRLRHPHLPVTYPPPLPCASWRACRPLFVTEASLKHGALWSGRSVLLVVTCAEVVVLEVKKDSPNSEADVLLLIPAEQVRIYSVLSATQVLAIVTLMVWC